MDLLCPPSLPPSPPSPIKPELLLPCRNQAAGSRIREELEKWRKRKEEKQKNREEGE
jgi:hypothetical protein